MKNDLEREMVDILDKPVVCILYFVTYTMEIGFMLFLALTFSVRPFFIIGTYFIIIILCIIFRINKINQSFLNYID